MFKHVHVQQYQWNQNYSTTKLISPWIIEANLEISSITYKKLVLVRTISGVSSIDKFIMIDSRVVDGDVILSG